MFTIGDFARHGRVSIRMLRHYDAIGLLRPAKVDRFSGYRFYTAAQLARLNRIIALKELGFTLQQVGEILDERVTGEQLRGMLLLRQTELRTAAAEAAARLAQVEARLRMIESEGSMPTQDVVVKSLPAVRLAELTGVATSFAPENIGPVIKPLYADLMCRLAEAGVTPTGPGIAYYEDSPTAEDAVLVHAGIEIAGDVPDSAGVAVVDLPPVPEAATIVHRGSMDNVLSSIQVLAKWIDGNGYRSTGYNRELYLEVPEDEDGWVTELQEPVRTV
ncbi:MerR family transcriptional regulator [Amycolatopsis suaedae]|uniref:MerR family transcriptional regulator n=1 Tax=Amycolatopsis suaedae TaxID=2510978 RepID=A0A4Q7J2K8_9PSEU|nr:MerR family transcriptional regulator [Amycolatopsis suaedae]RZQ61691.1 MerR family transcriptional regulator [Amycolatopsis suaedae]